MSENTKINTVESIRAEILAAKAEKLAERVARDANTRYIHQTHENGSCDVIKVVEGESVLENDGRRVNVRRVTWFAFVPQTDGTIERVSVASVIVGVTRMSNQKRTLIGKIDSESGEFAPNTSGGARATANRLHAFGASAWIARGTKATKAPEEWTYGLPQADTAMVDAMVVANLEW